MDGSKIWTPPIHEAARSLQCTAIPSSLTHGSIQAVMLTMAKAKWRQGIGRRLMATVLEAAKSHDFTEVTLHVLASNKRARAFYENLGWEVDIDPELENSMGETAPKARYRKSLQ